MKETKTWNNFVECNPRLNLKNFFERRGITTAEQLIAYCNDKRILPPMVEEIQHMFKAPALKVDLTDSREEVLEPQISETETETETETNEEKILKNSNKIKNKIQNEEDKIEIQQKRQNSK